MEHFRIDHLDYKMTHIHPLMANWDEGKIRSRMSEDCSHGRFTGKLLQFLECPDLETAKNTEKEEVKCTPKPKAKV